MDETPMSYADLLAAFERIAPITVKAEPVEFSTGPDPVGQWTVKPVRGGVPDAPVVKHVDFGACEAGYPCACPPVDVAAFQEQTRGMKMRDGYVAASIKPVPPVRSYGADGPVALSTHQALAQSDLELEPLPALEPLPMDIPADKATKPTAPTSDPHMMCKKERNALKLMVERREFQIKRLTAKLEQAEADYRSRHAEIARLKQENKELLRSEKSARKAAARLGKELAR